MNVAKRDALALDTVETPEDLVAALDFLRRRAARGTGKQKVGLDDLTVASGVPRSTLGTYLNGTSFVPADVLDGVVIALGCEPGEQRGWAEAWERASAWLARNREQQRNTTFGRLFNTAVPIADQVDPEGTIRARPVWDLAMHERTVIGPDRRRSFTDYRETLQAEADGADRCILLTGPNPQVDLSRIAVTNLVNCAPGNTRRLTDPPILVVELMLDHPLERDETYVLEYRVDYRPAFLDDAELAAAGVARRPTFEELRGYRKSMQLCTLEVVFQPDDLPEDVHQVFLEHREDPGTKVAPIPVSRWGSAHLTLEEPAVGIHGIRWRWPE